MQPKYSVVLGLLAVIAACSDKPPSDPTRSELVVQGVNYVGMSVSDIDRTTALYTGALQVSTADNASPDLDAFPPASSPDVTLQQSRLLRSTNAQLRLMQFDSPAGELPAVPVNGPGIAHVCFQVDDRTNAYSQLLDLGAEHIGAREMATLNPESPVKYAYAADQDGIILEMEHVDVVSLNLPKPPENQYRVRQVSLATPDIDRSVRFYSKLLQEPDPRRVGRWFWGLASPEVDKVSGLPDSKIQMAWFQVRNLELEIIEYLSHPVETPDAPRPIDALGFNMIMFDVTDLEAVKPLIAAAGGKVTGDTQMLDGAEVLFAHDPDGNLLGFQRLSPDSPYSAKHFKGNGT